ncbi:MAG: MarR family transcriptional regulator [Clostridia bacterium]|nr:MarR family transcriptional regulator [Clostridia bacterium]
MNDQVGHALHALNATMKRFIDNYSHKKENELLTGANTWVLHYIATNRDHPVYLRDVERQFGITRSSASKIVDLLVRKGFVERHTGDTDARLRRLTLTDKAEALLETIQQDNEMLETELLRGFSPNEIQTVLSYLHRMKNNIDAAGTKRQQAKKEGLS